MGDGGIDSLPLELLLRVLVFLEPCSCFIIPRVCSRWRDVAYSETYSIAMTRTWLSTSLMLHSVQRCLQGIAERTCTRPREARLPQFLVLLVEEDCDVLLEHLLCACERPSAAHRWIESFIGSTLHALSPRLPDVLLAVSENVVQSNAFGRSMCSPAGLACRENRAACLQVMLRHGLSPDATVQERTLVRIALLSRSEEVLDILMECGASMGWGHGPSPLQTAVGAGWPEAIPRIIAQRKRQSGAVPAVELLWAISAASELLDRASIVQLLPHLQGSERDFLRGVVLVLRHCIKAVDICRGSECLEALVSCLLRELGESHARRLWLVIFGDSDVLCDSVHSNSILYEKLLGAVPRPPPIELHARLWRSLRRAITQCRFEIADALLRHEAPLHDPVAVGHSMASQWSRDAPCALVLAAAVWVDTGRDEALVSVMNQLHKHTEADQDVCIASVLAMCPQERRRELKQTLESLLERAVYSDGPVV